MARLAVQVFDRCDMWKYLCLSEGEGVTVFDNTNHGLSGI